jgi:hypothetical protein
VFGSNFLIKKDLGPGREEDADEQDNDDRDRKDCDPELLHALTMMV